MSSTSRNIAQLQAKNDKNEKLIRRLLIELENKVDCSRCEAKVTCDVFKVLSCRDAIRKHYTLLEMLLEQEG